MDSISFPEPSDVLMGRWKIVAVLHAGERKIIYQARDLRSPHYPPLHPLVAITKFQNPEILPSKQMPVIQAFQSEIFKLVHISHEHRVLTKIFDVFQERGDIYLVTQYIHGINLEALLIKTKESPIEKIVEWAIELCDVLDYLHAQSPPYIIRDLKPAHIMVSSFGKIHLIDFAVMQRVASALGQPTGIGTEGYAAPECVRGEISPLTDIYSLGATLHHLITRLDPRLKHPFHVYDRPMREFNPQVSDGLEAIVMKALAFDPAERYQSAAEMKAALEAL